MAPAAATSTQAPQKITPAPAQKPKRKRARKTAKIPPKTPEIVPIESSSSESDSDEEMEVESVDGAKNSEAEDKRSKPEDPAPKQT